MNGAQKVIKYCAMAFAIFLSVVILGSIVSVVIGVSNGIAGVNYLWGEEKERIDLYEEYSVEDAKKLGITSVLVDCNAEIVVKTGNVLAIDAVNVTDEYEIRQTNGRFSIVQESPQIKIGFWFGNHSERETVTVTIPEALSMDQVKVLSGSGKVSVAGIAAENITIDSGSGSVAAEDMTANRLYVDSGSGRVSVVRAQVSETELLTGSGGVTIADSALGKLRLDTGSGAVSMGNVEVSDAKVDTGSGAVAVAGVLTGTCEFETGSGALAIHVDGQEEDYRVKAECGSGTFRINGKKMEDGSYGNKVKGELIIKSGSGSVSVEFNTPVEE